METDIKQTSKQSGPTYFAALDGFRGVLALMIAVYHTMWMSHANSSDLLTNGPVLVDIFFVFSGFLMFTLYDGRLNSGAEGRAFIKRRFARIYPIHFVMLIVAFLYAFARLAAHWAGLATVTPGEILPFEPGATETLQSFISNLTLTQSMGFHEHLSYNMPSWTVSVEFWTYFVFLGMMLRTRPKKAWHFMVIALLVGVNYFVLSRLKPDMDFHYDLGFWRCLGGFFTGVLVAYVYRLVLPRFQKLSMANWLATMIELVVLAVMVGFVIYFPGKAQFFIAPVAFIFVLGFSFDMGAISRFMGTRVLRYLGKISYSIYMVHILISLCFSIAAEMVLPRLFGPLWNATQIPGSLLLIPYLALVIFTSHFTFKYVEMPGRNAILAYNFGAKLKWFKGRPAK
ncbi:MAG: acyltransferase, partial [Robiginitomaculum sp.]|nr:acyltransferase [Robiginitomaculum sp.]